MVPYWLRTGLQAGCALEFFVVNIRHSRMLLTNIAG
jgi:hypothetical protein